MLRRWSESNHGNNDSDNDDNDSPTMERRRIDPNAEALVTSPVTALSPISSSLSSFLEALRQEEEENVGHDHDYYHDDHHDHELQQQQQQRPQQMASTHISDPRSRSRRRHHDDVADHYYDPSHSHDEEETARRIRGSGSSTTRRRSATSSTASHGELGKLTLSPTSPQDHPRRGRTTIQSLSSNKQQQQKGEKEEMGMAISNSGVDASFSSSTTSLGTTTTIDESRLQRLRNLIASRPPRQQQQQHNNNNNQQSSPGRRERRRRYHHHPADLQSLRDRLSAFTTTTTSSSTAVGTSKRSMSASPIRGGGGRISHQGQEHHASSSTLSSLPAPTYSGGSQQATDTAQQQQQQEDAVLMSSHDTSFQSSVSTSSGEMSVSISSYPHYYYGRHDDGSFPTTTASTRPTLGDYQTHSRIVEQDQAPQRPVRQMSRDGGMSFLSISSRSSSSSTSNSDSAATGSGNGGADASTVTTNDTPRARIRRQSSSSTAGSMTGNGNGLRNSDNSRRRGRRDAGSGSGSTDMEDMTSLAYSESSITYDASSHAGIAIGIPVGSSAIGGGGGDGGESSDTRDYVSSTSSSVGRETTSRTSSTDDRNVLLDLTIIHPDALVATESSLRSRTDHTTRSVSRHSSSTRRRHSTGGSTSVSKSNPYTGVMTAMVEQMHGSGGTLDLQEAMAVSRHSKQRVSMMDRKTKSSHHSRTSYSSSPSSSARSSRGKMTKRAVKTIDSHLAVKSSSSLSASLGSSSHSGDQSFALGSISTSSTSNLPGGSPGTPASGSPDTCSHKSLREDSRKSIGQDVGTGQRTTARRPRRHSTGSAAAAHAPKRMDSLSFATTSHSYRSSSSSSSHDRHDRSNRTNSWSISTKTSFGHSASISSNRSQGQSLFPLSFRNRSDSRRSIALSTSSERSSGGESESTSSNSTIGFENLEILHDSAPGRMQGNRRSVSLDAPRISVSSMLLTRDLSVSKRLAYMDASVRQRPPLPPGSFSGTITPNSTTRSSHRSTSLHRRDGSLSTSRSPSPDDRTVRASNRSCLRDGDKKEKSSPKPKPRARSHSPSTGCTSPYGHYSPFRRRSVLRRSYSSTCSDESDDEDDSDSSGSSLDMEALRKQYLLDRKMKKEKEQSLSANTQLESTRLHPPSSPSDVTLLIDHTGDGATDEDDSLSGKSVSTHGSYTLQPVSLAIPAVSEDNEGFVTISSTDTLRPMKSSSSSSSLPSLDSIHTFELRPICGDLSREKSFAQHRRTFDVSMLDDDEHNPSTLEYDVATRSYHSRQMNRGRQSDDNRSRDSLSRYLSSALPPPPFGMSSSSTMSVHSLSQRSSSHHVMRVRSLSPSPIWKKLETEKDRQDKLRERLRTYKIQSQ